MPTAPNNEEAQLAQLKLSERYSEPVSDKLKALMREDQLKMLGQLPDDATVYHDKQSLRQAFQRFLEKQSFS